MRKCRCYPISMFIQIFKTLSMSLRIFGFSIAALAIWLIVSCKELKTSELEDLEIYNVMDEGSGVDIFTVDSIVIKNKEAYFYFQTDLSGIKDPSIVNRVLIYRDGALTKWLTPGNFTYFVDINVVAGKTYIYQFALEDINRDPSKLSAPYEVTIK